MFQIQDQPFLDGMKLLKTEGRKVDTRNDNGSTMLAGVVNSYNLNRIYPALPIYTTKHVYLKSVIGELAGFLGGVCDAEEFKKLGTGIWKKNANMTQSWLDNPIRKGEDDLGAIYSKQWRQWEDTRIRKATPEIKGAMVSMGYDRVGRYTAQYTGEEVDVWHRTIDQVSRVIDTLKNNPTDRRIILLSFNPADIDHASLPACHCMFQIIPEPLSEVEAMEYAYKTKMSELATKLTDGEIVSRNLTNEQGMSLYAHNYDMLCKTRPIQNIHGTDQELYKEIYDLFTKTYKDGKGFKLSAVMMQRSTDVVLGSSFNVASYTILLRILGQLTGHPVMGRFVHVNGNYHMYSNQDEAAKECIRRYDECPSETITSINSFGNMHFRFNTDGIDPYLRDPKEVISSIEVLSQIDFGPLPSNIQPEMIE